MGEMIHKIWDCSQNILVFKDRNVCVLNIIIQIQASFFHVCLSVFFLPGEEGRRAERSNES